MGGARGEFFRGKLAKVLNLFRELGGPISIVVVVGFAVVWTLWGVHPTPSQPLQNHSIPTNVIWGVAVVFALLAAIFNPCSDTPEPRNYLNRWGGLMALVLLLIFPFLTCAYDSTAKAGLPAVWIAIFAVVLIALMLVAGWCLAVFTRPLKIMKDQNKVVSTIREMVLISYVFVLIALAVSFLPPFMLGIEYSMKEDSTPSTLYTAMVDSPVGLVRGCVHTRRESSSGWELACSTPSATPAAAATSAITTPANSAQAGASHTTTTPSEIPADNYSDQWLFKIGGTSLRDQEYDPRDAGSGFYPVTVYGGLAVPWYFIMLAIMGAAVSMARRVPEYQRDVQVPDPSDDGKTSGTNVEPASPSSAPKDDGKTSGAAAKPNTLSPVQVRELLVFQIMQVLSAPLIAITAYNAMMPTSRSTSVALAFVSGFASESVLLVISSIVEKIKPEASAP